MKRIGVFSKRIYSEEDYKNGLIKECCIMFDDEKKINYDTINKRFGECVFCPDYCRCYHETQK